MIKYHKMLKDLDKYPHLKKAVEHFYDTDGQAEELGLLPNLIIWIRNTIPDSVDPAEFFGMDNDTAEDFYSWGHNSRWANTFWTYLQTHFDWCVACCLDLADQYGDFDVEQTLKEAKNV